MLPAIGSIVFWIGVMIGAYIVLRCVDLFAASGARERGRIVQTLAAVVVIGVVIALLQAYGKWSALMSIADDAPRY